MSENITCLIYDEFDVLYLTKTYQYISIKSI